MRRYFGILLVLAAGFLGANAFAESAQPMPEFSTDIVMQSQGHDEVHGRTYVSNNKIRMETPGLITIIRKDLNVMWMLMPQVNMYMEKPFEFDEVTNTSRAMPGEIERLPMGKEMIDGQAADKFKVTYN